MGLDDEVTSIYSHPYDGIKGCTGYPVAGGCNDVADWWFETPMILKLMVPNALNTIYLCDNCWQQFMGEIAIGFVIVR